MNSISNFFKNLFGGQEKSSSKIIAAKVTKVEKHPNADRLRVIGLFDGQKEIYPIVCGAFNFDVGAIVALALPGAVIAHNIHSDTHESFVLDKATIRGVESQGMICAAFELGKDTEIGPPRLTEGETGQGIMLLPENTPLGSAI